jgi:thymidylate synthase
MTTTDVWRQTLRILLKDGAEVSPESMGANWRGRTNRELLGFQTCVPMSLPVVLCPGRKMGYRFMCAEAAAILEGDNSLAKIRPFSQQMDKMSEDGLTMTGHYGPPFRDQLHFVLAALKEDPMSRQAVVSLWRPNPALGGQIPCTLNLQWIVREDKINCLVSMRSSDAWMGLVYDWFAFSMMSAYISLALATRPDLGTLTITAGSQHLYKIDWEASGECITRDDLVADVSSLDLNEFDHPNMLVEHLWSFARREGLERHWLCDLDMAVR